ncbi:MAG: hypothetical protein JW723_12790 [Bacteroidales bacterium]|nr:hypothetical protein [Bacteroidales bacterium]
MHKVTKILLPVILTVIITTCDKWDDTADISHVSYLPEFEMIGGEFISIIKDTAGFKLPSVRATVQGKEVSCFYLYNEYDVNKPGVYIITYYAENDEGFSKTADRILAVTFESVIHNDLSGDYETSRFGAAEMRITRIDSMGFYKCEDVLGFPGAPMPGRIVDLGNNSLVLLPGEGYFGRYDISEGSYSKRTVSWTVILLDPPNTGIEIPVTWIKSE